MGLEEGYISLSLILVRSAADLPRTGIKKSSEQKVVHTDPHSRVHEIARDA